MEIKGTDYTARNKDVLVVTVGTKDDPIELHVFPPTVSVHEGMVKVAGYVDAAAKGERVGHESMSECLAFVSDAMSNNKEGRIVTEQELESMGFDMSDVSDFVGLYLFFLSKLVEGKN